MPDGRRHAISAAHHRRAPGARDDLLRPPLHRQGGGRDRPHQQMRAGEGVAQGDARLVRHDQGAQSADPADDQEEPQLRVRPALCLVAARHGIPGPCVGLGREPRGHERLPRRPQAGLPEVPHAQQARARRLSRRLRARSQRATLDAPQGRPMSAQPAGALFGIRVVDLTRILAGPLCTMMLGDMGAEIIKVEPPGTGVDTRTWGPPFVAGEAAYFLGVNRNKRSLTLNMATPAGQAILQSLVKRADVLIDNFKLGTLAKWGFTDDWFDAYAQRLVRCQITGYGSDGPKAPLPGYDFILQAESGLMSICGPADGGPTKYGVAIVDVCTGMLASNAILAALNARARTGKGQKVEVSLYESSLAMLVNVAANVLVTGKGGGRFGNGHPSIVPYTTYSAADAMVALAVGNDTQFAKAAGVLGHPEWAADARFSTNRARVENRDVLDRQIGEA